jgi:hypothetical protein
VQLSLLLLFLSTATSLSASFDDIVITLFNKKNHQRLAFDTRSQQTITTYETSNTRLLKKAIGENRYHLINMDTNLYLKDIQHWNWGKVGFREFADSPSFEWQFESIPGSDYTLIKNSATGYHLNATEKNGCTQAREANRKFLNWSIFQWKEETIKPDIQNSHAHEPIPTAKHSDRDVSAFTIEHVASGTRLGLDEAG